MSSTPVRGYTSTWYEEWQNDPSDVGLLFWKDLALGAGGISGRLRDAASALRLGRYANPST
jgi:hypothetical protein